MREEEIEEAEKIEREIEEVYEKRGREAVRELMEKIRRDGKEEPILALLAARGVLKAIKAEYRRAYQAQRLQLRITISPKERLLFEACREFAYSKGWLKEDTNRAFLRFCVETVLKNIWRQLKKEEKQLLREGKV